MHFLTMNFSCYDGNTDQFDEFSCPREMWKWEGTNQPLLRTRGFDCQTTSLLAFCLQGPGSPGETQLQDFTAVFPNYLVFWDVPLNSQIPSARAKFLSVNYYFQSIAKGLGWDVWKMPLHWKTPNTLLVVGAEQLENSWKKAIPKGFLWRKCFMTPESTCLLVWRKDKPPCFCEQFRDIWLPISLHCYRCTDLLWIAQEKPTYLGLNSLTKHQIGYKNSLCGMW